MNSPHKMLDFIVVGPQRTASSWLHQMLEQHPELSLPAGTKETFFWDKHYNKGWDWYERFFQESSSRARRGEVAPTVFVSASARERIFSAAPKCRVIVLLRDPVQRALSHYRHERTLGLVKGTLEEAARLDPRIIEASRYSTYLPRWMERFGERRVRFWHQDRIRETPQQIMKEICGFLGVNASMDFLGMEDRPSKAAAVRFPLVARFLYRTASRLRGAHFHRLVNLAKKTQIRELLQKDGDPVSEQDREFAEKTLWREREYVARLAAQALIP